MQCGDLKFNGNLTDQKRVVSCQKHRLTSISSYYIYHKGEKGDTLEKGSTLLIPHKLTNQLHMDALFDHMTFDDAPHVT